MTPALTFWGPNIVDAGRAQWRKYRRVMAPAFSNETYDLVWSESLRTYYDMIAAEGWDEKRVVEAPSFQDIASKYALLIITSCGFGLPFTWESPPSGSGSMTIQDAVYTITQTLTFSIVAPTWLWSLPIPWIQRTRKAYDTMRTFMRNHIQSRKADIRTRKAENDDWRKDVFNLLVQESESDGKATLSDYELIGNVFVLLIAGHQTTAHSLAATLALLALDQTVQNEIVAHIQDIVGEREPTFKDYSKLDKVLAAFHEGVRMFPGGAVLIREAKQDTTLVYPRLSSAGIEENVVLPVAKGVQILIDMVGVQYNPRYISEPEVYRPSRWYSKNTSESSSSVEHGDNATKGPSSMQDSEPFTAFSVGPRACIGRKFATTEAVCFLTLLLRDWKVEPLLRTGETTEEWRQRAMQATLTLALGIKDVPLKFVKR
ncbi:hypothetical protein SERLA73DRAFT_181431 [Serpula lacrymans var. lacrymans S7.3]|uniref:Cytochrome P450 n=2 Tax=Serpula lacrymans var. lacrymans TaxID=341189 RepID=F8PY28_SERL3|nr:uncharacterized protein SERLADRAFT_467573 [Serpula lacrymans var. lacrymans S7.9]EGN98791.1 hypothetical protein SERLA73DRAFT_181431 [Serpula lacrymans var. lacrymans S7.3]EGO24385.1 hypothetical protein SERLADRAFT_467573 [Serpula lacrymans var. lacrymans S7.9]